MGFFPGGKSNYAQQKVLWNSISDSAVVAFQHILIWAHQRQHVISCNQLCLGVVKVGVWYGTSLCLGSNASNSVMILLSGLSCCNVTQHSTSAFVLILYKAIHHNAAPVGNYIQTHGASICHILLISFVPTTPIASVIWGQCVLFSFFFLPCLAMYSRRGLSCNRGSLTRLSFSPSLQADKR